MGDNSNVDVSQLPDYIQELVRLEHAFGHDCFLFGLDSSEEAVEKYQYVISLMRDLQITEKGSTEFCEAKDQLCGMLSAKILSSEAAAVIQTWNGLECEKAHEVIEEFLQGYSLSEWAQYCALYYKNQNATLNNKLIRAAELINDREIMVNVRDNIDEMYAAYYNRIETGNGVFCGKGAVYTVITGSYDKLWNPEIVNEGWDYYLFTDRPEMFSSKIWKIVDIKECCRDIVLSDEKLINRYVKTHPHLLLSEYDYTIYIDGSIKIIGDLTEYINSFSRDYSMLAFPHPSRNSLYEEAEAVISLNKADPTVIMKQMEKYKSEGYEECRPMISAGCLIRSNKDDLLNRTMEDWWIEIRDTSPRDQLSLGYCCWKNDYWYDICPLFILRNKYIEIQKHV